LRTKNKIVSFYSIPIHSVHPASFPGLVHEWNNIIFWYLRFLRRDYEDVTSYTGETQYICQKWK
jgi:hypothetical protein